MAEAASLETATAAMNVSTDTGSGAVPPAAKPVDVQTLMKSDPRFIARLIQQLDSQMHNMQDEKKRRQQAITEDTEEMQRIDQEIKMHVQPGIDNMNKRMQQKEQTRTALKQQLETQCKTFSNVEKDAQALLLKALHAGRKVTRENASGLLKEVRGYSAAEPTTKLIRGSSKKAQSQS